jgi:hypothetical protein
MLAFGQKTREPRLRLRGRIGAGHADGVEAVCARGAHQRQLDGGGIDQGMIPKSRRLFGCGWL